MKLKVTVNDVPYEVEVELEESYPALPIINMGTVGLPPVVAKAGSEQSGHTVVAPLAGSVRRIIVDEGDIVETGDIIALLEAMKMETEITSPVDGTVKKVFVEPGAAVQGGDAIFEIA